MSHGGVRERAFQQKGHKCKCPEALAPVRNQKKTRVAQRERSEWEGEE